MARKFLTPILLPADPTVALEAATKQYVDSKAGGGVTDGDKVDVVISGSGATWQLSIPTQTSEPAGTPEGHLWWDADEPTLVSSAPSLACELIHSVAQTIPNTTATAVTFDTEYFDDGGLHAAGAPTRITIPTGGGGVWSFAYSFTYTANATGFRSAWLRVDGNTADRRALCNVSNSSGWDTTLGGAHLCRLIEGQYIELVTSQTSGAGLALLGAASANHVSVLSATRVST